MHLHVIFQDMVNSYQCVCEAGWTGTDCDISISISECGTNCQAQTGEQAGGEIINFDYITGTFKLVFYHSAWAFLRYTMEDKSVILCYDVIAEYNRFIVHGTSKDRHAVLRIREL